MSHSFELLQWPSERHNPVPGLLIVLAISLVFTCAVAVVSDHAIERHGQQAITAHQAVQSGGQRHDCNDGRTRFVAKVGKMWAVEVWDGATLITSFLTPSQSYIQVMLEDCGDGHLWAHP